MSQKATPGTPAPHQDPVAVSLLRDLKTSDPTERKRELLRRVQVLRSGMANVGAVTNKTPGYAYCWVHNDRQVIDYYAGVGYEQVTSSNDPDVTTAFRKEDGRHVRGDAILLRVHSEIVEALDADRDLRALDRIDSARDEFAQWGASSGVTIERGRNHGQN